METEAPPTKLSCRRCRRHYRLESLVAKSDLLLTEVRLVCPRCKKALFSMRLKDWYEKYVHGI